MSDYLIANKIMAHFPPPSKNPFFNLENLIIESYLEILDLLHIHLSIRNEISYTMIDFIMKTCVLERIRQIKSSLTTTECSEIKDWVHRLNRILKNDFLLYNLYKQRRHMIY